MFGFFNKNKINKSIMAELKNNQNIVFNTERFKSLGNQYKHIFTIITGGLPSFEEWHPEEMGAILNYKIKNECDSSYSIYVDSLNGQIVFAHQRQVVIGGAYTSEVINAKIISYENMKKTLLFVIDKYKVLIDKWEKECNKERMQSCLDELNRLKRIEKIQEADWKQLLEVVEC